MDNINKKAVGHRIKTIRTQKGLTMKEFGKLVEEAAQSLVTRWENGTSFPNNERLKKIAEIGGVTVNELLYGDFESYCYGIFDTVNADKKYNLNNFVFLNDRKQKEDFYSKVFSYVQEFQYGYEDNERIYNLYHKSVAKEVEGTDFTNEGSFNYIQNELEKIKWELRNYFYTPFIPKDNSDAKPGDTVVIASGGIPRKGADLDLYKKQQKLLAEAKNQFIDLEMDYKENEQ